MDSSVIDKIRETERLLRVTVKIPWDEADRITINRLIEIRNVHTNQDMTHFDKVIRHFIDEEEFQKYVIEKQEIEY